jgi:hypothetical protein
MFACYSSTNGGAAGGSCFIGLLDIFGFGEHSLILVYILLPVLLLAYSVALSTTALSKL